MAQYIVDSEGRVLITLESGAVPAGITDRAIKEFKEIGDAVKEIADDLFSGIAAAVSNLSEVTVTIDIGIEGETGIPFLAKGKADASIGFEMKWQRS